MVGFLTCVKWNDCIRKHGRNLVENIRTRQVFQETPGNLSCLYTFPTLFLLCFLLRKPPVFCSVVHGLDHCDSLPFIYSNIGHIILGVTVLGWPRPFLELMCERSPHGEKDRNKVHEYSVHQRNTVTQGTVSWIKGLWDITTVQLHRNAPWTHYISILTRGNGQDSLFCYLGKHGSGSSASTALDHRQARLWLCSCSLGTALRASTALALRARLFGRARLLSFGGARLWLFRNSTVLPILCNQQPAFLKTPNPPNTLPRLPAQHCGLVRAALLAVLKVT